jgi:hypothetical protein
MRHMGLRTNLTHAELADPASQRTRPLAGVHEIYLVGHGRAGAMYAGHHAGGGSGSIPTLDGRAVAALLRANGFRPGPGAAVFVDACDGAASCRGSSFADDLARHLGVPVTAATGPVVPSRKYDGTIGGGGFVARTDLGSTFVTCTPTATGVDRTSLTPARR